MMPSDAGSSAKPTAVILAAKVLAGNRRVPALRQSLVDAGWAVELIAMAPIPDGLDAIGLGAPGRGERWMDRMRRLGPVGRALAGWMQQHGRKRHAADRRARYFAELQAHGHGLEHADLVVAHDSFAAGWASQHLPPDATLIADFVEDIETRTYSVIDAPDLKVLIQRPDAMLTISEGMKNRLVSQGAPTAQVSVVMNALPHSAVATEINSQPEIDLVSAGTIYPGDGVDNLVRAAGLGGLSLVIVGSCPDVAYAKRLRSLIAETGSSSIVWIGAVSATELARHVRSARALVLAYTPGPPNFQHAMPNRVFSALAAGTPLLVQSGLDVADWVEAHGVGAGIDFRSVASAAESLKAALVEDLRQSYANAALRVARQIAWEVQSEAFLTTISALQGARSMASGDGDSS